MATPEERAHGYIVALIQAGGWDLRYTHDGKPYAYLPHGFGNREENCKLYFIHYKKFTLRVVGVIEDSKEIKIRRPYVMCSMNRYVHDAAQLIEDVLIPEYKKVWYEALEKRKNHHEP